MKHLAIATVLVMCSPVYAYAVTDKEIIDQCVYQVVMKWPDAEQGGKRYETVWKEQFRPMHDYEGKYQGRFYFTAVVDFVEHWPEGQNPYYPSPPETFHKVYRIDCIINDDRTRMVIRRWR